jgi:5-methyltetrahydrofolate--homocysteine methyltransferase
MPKYDEIFTSVMVGDSKACRQSVEEAIEQGESADDILNQALIPAMQEVGIKFEQQEYFIPEMLIAAKAMQSGLVVLRPLLAETGVEPIARVAIGTVQGDLHDIGKNLVVMMLEGGGFEVVDLGVDAQNEQFVTAVKDGAQLIGLSALLTTTMKKMRGVLDALEEAGLREDVKVIVGGAPVTPEFAQEIGADGYAEDASKAVTLSKSLLGKS